MIIVAGIRFKKAGKIYYFDPQNVEYKRGDKVIVETARGVEFGTVEIANKPVEEKDIVAPLKPILRTATEEDVQHHSENYEMAERAGETFKAKMKDHNLEMSLIETEYTFDRNKLIFYFTAEGRIDFRELVKDLAAIFRTRIELRQIGVRDEAKALGGLGYCGRPLCCGTWLGDFQSVSIKMAKDQNLSLNPTKISGICGRLFCCLKYEHDVYEELIRNLPSVGSIVETPDGLGRILDVAVISQDVRVQLNNKDPEILEIKKYKAGDIKIIKLAKKVSEENHQLEKELKKLLED